MPGPIIIPGSQPPGCERAGVQATILRKAAVRSERADVVNMTASYMAGSLIISR
jgi:hypothetical protein